MGSNDCGVTRWTSEMLIAEVDRLTVDRDNLLRQVSDLRSDVNEAIELLAYLVDKSGGSVAIPADYLDDPVRHVLGLVKSVDSRTGDWILEVVKKGV